MPALQNSRHERFAQDIVLGKSGREAYRAAGYKPKSDAAADASASRLLSDVKVAARVDELKKAAAAKTVDKVASIIAELEKLAFANMLDYTAIDDHGQIYNDFSKLTRDQAAAIQEITVETRTEYEYEVGGEKIAIPVRKVKFRLSDKRGALNDLLEHYGGKAPQRHEHTGKDGKPIEVEDKSEPLSDLEIARRMAFLLARGARTKAPAPATPQPAAVAAPPPQTETPNG